MQSDLNVYVLPDELLLDFEPGLTQGVSQRLEKYVIADDVQVVGRIRFICVRTAKAAASV
jgi:folate-binding Fe-S cluster repair protein YgfZ